MSLVLDDSNTELTGFHSAANSDTESDTSVNSMPSHRVESNEPQQASVIRDYVDEVVRIVDDLFALSILIRGTSPNFRVTRAAAHVEKDTEGNDVLAAFKSIVSLRIAALYPETPPWLIQRLTNLVGMRRQQFYYQRAHKRHLARTPTDFQDEDPIVSIPTTGGSELHSSRRKDHEMPSETRQTPSAPRTTKSRTTMKTWDTTATELKLDDAQRETPPTFKIAFSEKRLGENIFPNPPKEPRGKAFECNQCFHILPDATRKVSSWRLMSYFLN